MSGALVSESPPAALFAFDDAACLAHAARIGTPCFLYDGALPAARYATLRAALPPRVRIAYAVKANPHPALLESLARQGSSFDVASAGELGRVAQLGVGGERVLFAGPGKRESELLAAVHLGARVQAEGWDDLRRLDAIAALRSAGQPQPAPLRVNLRVHPLQAPAEGARILGGSGPSAFGVDEEDLSALLARARQLQHVQIAGLHVFAASNQRDAERLLEAHAYAFGIAARLQRELGAPLEQIDLGGGLGVPYAADESPLDVEALGAGLARLLERERWFEGELLVEPGRWLAAPCGVYLARVVRTKLSRGTRFAVLEGGINQLLRPLLTGQPFPVRRVGGPASAGANAADSADVADAVTAGGIEHPTVLAGPLCTALDRLGQVLLPELVPGDLLAFGMTGAYGFTEAMPLFLSHTAPHEAWIG